LPRVLVEICCGSSEDATAAQEGGADRVELCTALCVGGLTPSLGAIEEARARLSIPIVAMVRPRAAGFRYRNHEIAVMERDVEGALAAGASGVVFGVLDDEGEIEIPSCRRLRRAAADRQAVFHRAFDLVSDPVRALEQLIDLGFTRVLTSGLSASASLGASRLRRLIEQADGRIEILPGGGIRPENVRELVAKTGCRQVHLSAFGIESDPSTSRRPELVLETAHAPASSYARTDVAKVRAIVGALGESGPS
jgi:copper homeostasis protein